MNLKQLLKKTLKEWADISGLDFCLFDNTGKLFLPAASHSVPSEDKIKAFLEEDACSKATDTIHYYKITLGNELFYILVVWGKGTQAHTIGELAVCQIETILETTREKLDKNTYMQNLLLGNYTAIDARNRAKRLRINPSVPRAVFIVETKQARDEHALATIQNLYSSLSGNFIFSVNEENIILVKEVRETDTYTSLEQTALTIVDMLNTEAMTSAWAAYGNIAKDLSELPCAYKEALTSLEVGKIFQPTQNTFGYRNLGIGHLIYQLPKDICEKFLDETFKGEKLSSIDDESLNIIRTFFENNLNLSETARNLYLHRNTLVYRMEKIEKRFGLDIRSFEDAVTFKMAMMVSDYLNYRRS